RAPGGGRHSPRHGTGGGDPLGLRLGRRRPARPRAARPAPPRGRALGGRGDRRNRASEARGGEGWRHAEDRARPWRWAVIRGLLLALLPLVFGIPRGAQAAPRALLVEVKGSGWP